MAPWYLLKCIEEGYIWLYVLTAFYFLYFYNITFKSSK
jgi:hypothetical protein